MHMCGVLDASPLCVCVFIKRAKMCHMPTLCTSVCLYNEWKECTTCLLLVYACGVHICAMLHVFSFLCVCVCVCEAMRGYTKYFCLWNFSHLSLLLFEFWAPFLFLIIDYSISISIVSVSFHIFPLLCKKKKKVSEGKGVVQYVVRPLVFTYLFPFCGADLVLGLLLHQYHSSPVPLVP